MADNDIRDENYNLDEDFEEEEEIVTLLNENTGKEEDFRVVWVVEYNDKNYVLLNPVEPNEEIGEDEIMICELGENEGGEEFILPVDNDELLQAVYNEYVKEYNELQSEIDDEQ